MDDVATNTKVAAKKTAGILGDDLAVNAEKASGFSPKREIPVLWAITKGSLLNKVIILPLAFLLSAFLPWAVTIVLLLGGLYLGYEGAEKVYEFFFPHTNKKLPKKVVVAQSKAEILEEEKGRIKSAIFTDFILSVEIIIIALGTVIAEPISIQIIVVTIIALAATIGVYGIVALIIRMDDLGYRMIKNNAEENSFSRKTGKALVKSLPYVIKGLTIIGTIALFLVAGGIFKHNIDFLHHFFPALPAMLSEFILGLIVGFLCLLLISGSIKLWKMIKK